MMVCRGVNELYMPWRPQALLGKTYRDPSDIDTRTPTATRARAAAGRGAGVAARWTRRGGARFKGKGGYRGRLRDGSRDSAVSTRRRAGPGPERRARGPPAPGGPSRAGGPRARRSRARGARRARGEAGTARSPVLTRTPGRGAPAVPSVHDRSVGDDSEPNRGKPRTWARDFDHARHSYYSGVKIPMVGFRHVRRTRCC